MWRIEYYTGSSGRQPVAEWLDDLDKKTREYLRDKAVRLQQYGLELLETNMIRPIKGYGGDFYEIKYSQYRIAFYHDIVNGAFVLLHGFKKEHRKESKEIKIAYTRLRDYQLRG
jgi:phage-related protein